MTSVFETLERRGYVEQLTHPEEIKKLFETESVPFYIGIDPTADSLHVGHFISLMVASHMQRAGHKPIILMGGGTAIIGDPSGKTDMRKMLTVEDIDNNVANIKKQIEKFLSFEGDNAAIIVNNGDWLRDLNYINFMREVGVHFSVNRMLAAECYKNRLETGLTFFELGYMLMQSYDFLYLHDHYGCKLEMGGNDQWSNIIGGVELIRKIGADDAYGFTFKLLTTKEGKKMGKTEKGALWLNPEKTSPYEFYQYWRNVDDADVLNCMRLLTFLPIEEIDAMKDWEGAQLNKAKEILAYELTKLVHNEEEAKKAEQTAKSIFTGGDSENMPSVEISLDAFKEDVIDIISIVHLAGLVSSRSEARRAIEQGGISINGERVNSIEEKFPLEIFKDGVVVKKGKKSFKKVTVKK